MAKVAPDLVGRDADGSPYTVRYHVLPSLLLNEAQKQQRTIESQQGTIDALLARVEQLEEGRAADHSGTDR